MSNDIVTVNVSQQSAGAPSTLQRTGAFVSQGATTTAPGTLTLLAVDSDLADILQGALALTSLAWSGSVVTAATAAPHGIPNGDVVPLTIAGSTPSGYNGTFQCTSTGASAFTYPLVANPGAETVPGVYTPEDVAELVGMNADFFAQGSQLSVYVLELGDGDADTGITALSAFITGTARQRIYSYLVPRYWAADAGFKTFAATFNTTTSRTYFFTTMTTGNYGSFAGGPKSIIGLIQSPDAPSSEFTLAAAFRSSLNYNPAPTNRVTPFAFAELFGVTPYAEDGNAALFTALKAAYINIAREGAEGGLTNDFLYWGTALDGRDFSYWYSVDWVQITSQQRIAAAVLQGSNQPVNPLYFDQPGINRLQGVLGQVASQGVSNGLILGTPVLTQYDQTTFLQLVDDGAFAGQTAINAIPFLTYVGLNPTDLPAGIYSGFTMVYSPNRGFKDIIFNVLVTDFAAGNQ